MINAHKYPNRRDEGFSIYILWICAHVYAMSQRKVLDNNEWTGGCIGWEIVLGNEQYVKKWKQVEPDRWLNPAIQ